MKIKQKLRRVFLRRRNGYTLVEVIVASALLAILLIGMTLFIGPVVANVNDNDRNARASNVAENVQYYISRSIRNSAFVAVFTNATMGDFTQQSIINDASKPQHMVLSGSENGSMKKFIDSNNIAGKTLYDLKCISIKKSTDAKTGESKYFLYDEYFTTGAETLDSSKSVKVFEDCFFENLYMKCALDRVEHKAGGSESGSEASSDSSSDSDSDSDSTPTPGTKYRPALSISIKMYDTEAMGDFDLIFSGIGYTELVNIKNAQADTTLKLPYKMFNLDDADYPVSLGTGEDTFIFYVVRRVI